MTIDEDGMLWIAIYNGWKASLVVNIHLSSFLTYCSLSCADPFLIPGGDSHIKVTGVIVDNFKKNP